MKLEHSEIFQKNGVALGGYDVVAYFAEKVAKQGKSEYAYEWNGVQWFFSKPEYLRLFQHNPEKYLPKYGGYCAFGASQGYKVGTKPDAFYLHNENLYFNFAKCVQERWLEKRDERIHQADESWDQIKGSTPIKASSIAIWWKYKFLKLFGKDIFK